MLHSRYHDEQYTVFFLRKTYHHGHKVQPWFHWTMKKKIKNVEMCYGPMKLGWKKKFLNYLFCSHFFFLCHKSLTFEQGGVDLSMQIVTYDHNTVMSLDP